MEIQLMIAAMGEMHLERQEDGLWMAWSCGYSCGDMDSVGEAVRTLYEAWKHYAKRRGELHRDIADPTGGGGYFEREGGE